MSWTVFTASVGKSNFAEDVAVNQSQNVEGANKSQNTDIRS